MLQGTAPAVAQHPNAALAAPACAGTTLDRGKEGLNGCNFTGARGLTVRGPGMLCTTKTQVHSMCRYKALGTGVGLTAARQQKSTSYHCHRSSCPLKPLMLHRQAGWLAGHCALGFKKLSHPLFAHAQHAPIPLCNHHGHLHRPPQLPLALMDSAVLSTGSHSLSLPGDRNTT